MKLDKTQWVKEIDSHREFFQAFGSELPTDFISMYENLKIKFLGTETKGINSQLMM